jgi:hypothetical protein
MGRAARAVVNMRRLVASAALTLASLTPHRAFAHPLHTTLTEITEDRARGVVRATIRVFADDIDHSLKRGAHVPAPIGSPAWNAAAISYAASVFTMSTKPGVPMPLRSCGVTQKADVLWICLEANAPSGAASLVVRNAMLCDQFEDQVNIVQATFAGSRHSVLFTRGDRLKPLS